MKVIIIDLQKKWVCKVQLTIEINFISTKNVYKEGAMHSKNDNTKFTTYDNANDVVDELLKLLLPRYQIGLET